MAIITRDLLEQFLRATAWEQDERRAAQGAWSAYRGNTLHVLTVDDIDAAVEVLIKADGASVRERLGVCAVAEVLRGTAESCRANPCPENAATSRQLELEIAALLKWAGVDPERWEAARKERA